MPFFVVLHSICSRLPAVDYTFHLSAPVSLLFDTVFKTYGQCTFPPLSSLLPDSRVRLPERGFGRGVDELAEWSYKDFIAPGSFNPVLGSPEFF